MNVHGGKIHFSNLSLKLDKDKVRKNTKFSAQYLLLMSARPTNTVTWVVDTNY